MKDVRIYKVAADNKVLRFVADNDMLAWRAQSLTTKEPATIEWLRGLEKDEVLLDVGANVGTYTIFAAVVQGCRVVALEPEALNFATLCMNVQLNGLQERVDVWPFAASSSSGYDMLYLSQFSAGGSCHSYGAEVGFDLKPRPSPRRQGCHAVAIDRMVDGGAFPQPDHVKIDVDGIEHLVIAGMMRTLPRVRSLCVELNLNLAEHREVRGLLQTLGYKLDAAQVDAALRKEGPFKNVGEHVFTRA